MQDAIRKLQHDFDQAELHADTERLEQLIAGDFLSIGPKGFLLNKEQWINRHKQFKYQALDASDMDIRLYDKTAIVRNIQKNTSTYQDEAMELTMRVSQVWVYQPSGEWQLAAIQFSPMVQG